MMGYTHWYYIAMKIDLWFVQCMYVWSILLLGLVIAAFELLEENETFSSAEIVSASGCTVPADSQNHIQSHTLLCDCIIRYTYDCSRFFVNENHI